PHICYMINKQPTIESGEEGWGLSEDELQGIVSGATPPKDEFERVCFDYIRATSADPTAVPEEILNRLRQHLTPPQIVELACVAGFWKFYNTVHDSLHIPVESFLLADTGYVDLAPVHAGK
ncbi:MAG: carboxymuconolactone decarboxylase family protein, partial [Candidatus Binataceae bacterium]